MKWTYETACLKLLMRTLPESFDEWELRDPDSGCTVAHISARCIGIPDGFDRLDLRDNHGTTVAHAAARGGHLPYGFDNWDWANDAGYTVGEANAEWVAEQL